MESFTYVSYHITLTIPPCKIFYTRILPNKPDSIFHTNFFNLKYLVFSENSLEAFLTKFIFFFRFPARIFFSVLKIRNMISILQSSFRNMPRYSVSFTFIYFSHMAWFKHSTTLAMHATREKLSAHETPHLPLFAVTKSCSSHSHSSIVL